MKVAILGGTGMLGSMLTCYLYKSFQLVVTCRADLYLKQVFEKQFKKVEWRTFIAGEDNLEPVIWDCEWVINAIGAIPQSSPSYEDYYYANIVLPIKLTEAIENLGSHAIQILTDCVYSGKKGGYIETDVTDPVDDYGRSKAMGEVSAKVLPIKFDETFYTRCSIVGPDPFNRSLLGWFLGLKKNAVVKGYVNHKWNGITTLHFAKICRALIENTEIEDCPSFHLSQLIHIVPANSVSKYDLLNLFAKYFKRQDVKIEPVEAKKSIDRTLATLRPDFCNLLWEGAGYRVPPTIEEMVGELAEYMKV